MVDSVYFSIIIPTLNEEKSLPKLLNNLKDQKDKNFEVIVVDGASTDSTKKKALVFNQNFPLKFYVHEKKNVSFQRNFGAKVSTGTYLIFLDADAGVKANFTHNLKQIIIKRKGLVFIPYIIPDQNDSQTKLIFKVANFLIEFSQNLGKPFSASGNMIWEKKFFETVGGFDESLYLAEDHKIIQDAYSWGVKTKFLHKIKVKFSLRRMRREGQLAMFYKYLIATAHVLIKGDIKNKIFEYEMGGSVGNSAKNFFPFEQNFKNYLQQLKRFFEAYLR